VGIQLKHRLPSGETRPWTLKEIIQGRPFDRVTHPMFVHFPIAGYVGALALDVMSKLWTFPSAPLAASWLIIGAFAGTVAAATTGLVDRSTMRPGSRIRGVANQHLWVQLAAAGVFILNFALRWSDRHLAEAKAIWIILDVIGVLVVSVGADIGGRMVYKMGFRVGGSADE
jgi:uncharacterized membrane protein